MTTIDRKLYGFEIEGFGDGYLHGLGQAIRVSTEAFVDPVLGVRYVRGLAEWPQKISTTTDVLKGHTRISTMDMIIDGLDEGDRQGSSYGRLLLDYLWRARVQPVGFLQSPLDATSTSFNVEIIAGEDINDFVPLYIGREVMNITNIGGALPTLLIDVDRGILGSDAEAHPLDDGEVFLLNPVRQDRRVTLYEYDLDAGIETVRWRGVIESLDLSDDTTRLIVKCIDIVGTLSKFKVGEGRWVGKVKAKRGSFNNSKEPVLYGQLVDSGRALEYQPLHPEIPDGYLPGTARLAPLGVTTYGACLEVDGVAVVAPVNPPSPVPATLTLWRYGVRGGPMLEISGKRIEVDDTFNELKAAEILVCDADNPMCMFKDIQENPSDHPAIICLNLLLSTGTADWTGTPSPGVNGDFDWLPKAWGRGLPPSWVDAISFVELTRGWPASGMRARAGYIGGGELKSYTDTIADLLQSMGAYFYVDSQGRIAARRLADPGVGNTDHSLDAEVLSGSEGEADAQGLQAPKPVAEIRLKCAQDGPGGKTSFELPAKMIGQAVLTRYKYHATTDILDSTAIYGDPVRHDLSNTEIEQLGAAFSSRYRYTQDKLPMYRLRTAVGGPIVTAGQWVTLEHPYFFDGQTLARGITGARCLVLEANWEPATGQCELMIVDWSPASKATTLLCPAWRVESVTSATVFDLDSDYFTEDDTALFEVGYEAPIELWSENGKTTAINRVYASSIVGTTVTLAAAFNDGSKDLSPSPGDFIRVANINTADPDTWEDLELTWLGDTTGKIKGGTADGGRWDL